MMSTHKMSSRFLPFLAFTFSSWRYNQDMRRVCKFCDFTIDTNDVMVPKCSEHRSVICPMCMMCQAVTVTPAKRKRANERRRIRELVNAMFYARQN